jgi:hypothetical protein
VSLSAMRAVIARSESDEAIQADAGQSLDCFASLAMTAFDRNDC